MIYRPGNNPPSKAKSWNYPGFPPAPKTFWLDDSYGPRMGQKWRTEVPIPGKWKMGSQWFAASGCLGSQ